MWSSIKLPNPTAFFRFFSRRSTSYLVKAILARHIPYMRQKSMEILLFNNSSKRRESALDASDPEVLQSLKAADEAALHPYKSPGSSPPKDFYSRQFLTWWDLAEKVGLPLSALHGLPLTLPSSWQGPSVNKNFMAKKREPNEPNCIFQAPESPRIPTSVLQAAEAVARLCALHTLQVFPSGCVASIALQSESYHTNTPLALHTHHTHTHTTPPSRVSKVVPLVSSFSHLDKASRSLLQTPYKCPAVWTMPSSLAGVVRERRRFWREFGLAEGTGPPSLTLPPSSPLVFGGVITPRIF